MMTLSNWYRPLLRIGLIALIAATAVGCSTSTPEPTPTPLPPTPTPEPTSTPTPEPSSTPTDTPEPTNTRTPRPTNTPAATSTPSFTPTPRVTNTPRNTSTPTRLPVPPLLKTVLETRVHVDDIGGALDRIYQGGGAEACAPLLFDYYAVVNSPVYNVSGQGGNVQGAYGLYRAAIEIIADKISKIRDLCEGGGGVLGPLDFDISRMAISEASGHLGSAIGLLENP